MCPALYTPGAAPPVGSYRRTPRVQSPSAIEPSQRPLRPGGCGSISAHQSLARPLLYFTTAPLHAVPALLLLSTHPSSTCAHAHARTNCLRVRAHRKSIADTRLACLSQISGPAFQLQQHPLSPTALLTAYTDPLCILQPRHLPRVRLPVPATLFAGAWRRRFRTHDASCECQPL